MYEYGAGDSGRRATSELNSHFYPKTLLLTHRLQEAKARGVQNILALRGGVYDL